MKLQSKHDNRKVKGQRISAVSDSVLSDLLIKLKLRGCSCSRSVWATRKSCYLAQSVLNSYMGLSLFIFCIFALSAWFSGRQAYVFFFTDRITISQVRVAGKLQSFCANSILAWNIHCGTYFMLSFELTTVRQINYENRLQRSDAYQG